MAEEERKIIKSKDGSIIGAGEEGDLSWINSGMSPRIIPDKNGLTDLDWVAIKFPNLSDLSIIHHRPDGVDIVSEKALTTENQDYVFNPEHVGHVPIRQPKDERRES